MTRPSASRSQARRFIAPRHVLSWVSARASACEVASRCGVPLLDSVASSAAACQQHPNRERGHQPHEESSDSPFPHTGSIASGAAPRYAIHPAATVLRSIAGDTGLAKTQQKGRTLKILTRRSLVPEQPSSYVVRRPRPDEPEARVATDRE